MRSINEGFDDCFIDVNDYLVDLQGHLCCPIDNDLSETQTLCLLTLLESHRGKIPSELIPKMEQWILSLTSVMLRKFDFLNTQLPAERCLEPPSKKIKSDQERLYNQESAVRCYFMTTALYFECLLFLCIPTKVFIDEVNQKCLTSLRSFCRLVPNFGDINDDCHVSLQKVLKLLSEVLMHFTFTTSQVHSLVSVFIENVRRFDSSSSIWARNADLLVLVARRCPSIRLSILTDLADAIMKLEWKSKADTSFILSDGVSMLKITNLILRVFQVFSSYQKGTDSAFLSFDSNTKNPCAPWDTRALSRNFSEQLFFLGMDPDCKDGRKILRLLIVDLCKAFRNPMWPIGQVLLADFVFLLAKTLLLSFSENSNKIEKKVDHYGKEFCINLLGFVGGHLFSLESDNRRLGVVLSEAKASFLDMKKFWEKCDLCICGKPCGNEFVECEKCLKKIHLACLGINLQRSKVSWCCFLCSVQQVASNINDSYKTKKQNFQWMLSDILCFPAVVMFYEIIVAHVCSSGCKSEFSEVSFPAVERESTFLTNDAMFAGETHVQTLFSTYIKCDYTSESHTKSLTEMFCCVMNENGEALVPGNLAANIWRLLSCDFLKGTRITIFRCVSFVLSKRTSDSLKICGVAALSELITSDCSLVQNQFVVKFLKEALVDKSSKVREKALLLLYRAVMEQICPAVKLDFLKDRNIENRQKFIDNWYENGLEGDLVCNTDDRFKLTVPVFIDIFCRMTNDCSVAVRTQAIKVIKAVCHLITEENVVQSVCGCLLERLSDTSETNIVKNLVLDTLAEMWFRDHTLSPNNLSLMVKMINMSENLFEEDSSVFHLVCKKFAKKKGVPVSSIEIIAKTLKRLLDFFLENALKDTSIEFSPLLTAIKVIGSCRPEILAEYVCHLRIYIHLEIGEKRIPIHQICELMAIGIPYVSKHNGCIEMVRSIQNDLLLLLYTNTRTVRCAIGCLCECIKCITFDFRDYITVLVVRPVTKLVETLNTSLKLYEPAQETLRPKIVSDSQRMCFQTACVLEQLDPDAWIPEEQISELLNQNENVKRRIIVDSSLKSCRITMKQLFFYILCIYFECTTNSNLHSFLLPTFGLFLKNYPSFIGNIAFHNVISKSLNSKHTLLRDSACQTIYQVLRSVRSIVESVSDKGEISFHSEIKVSCPSASIDMIQPLSVHLDKVVSFLEGYYFFEPQSSSGNIDYPMLVLEQLYGYGFINPSHIVATLFSVYLGTDGRVKHKANLLLSSLIEIHPRSFSSNIIKCIRKSFVFLISPMHPRRLELFKKFDSNIYDSFGRIFGSTKIKLRDKILKALCEEIKNVGYCENIVSDIVTHEKAALLLNRTDLKWKEVLKAIPKRFFSCNRRLYESKSSELSPSHIFAILYLQFIVSMLCNINFVYENEIKFVLSELSKFVSTHWLMIGDVPDSSILSNDSESNFFLSCCSFLTANIIMEHLKNKFLIDKDLSDSGSTELDKYRKLTRVRLVQSKNICESDCFPLQYFVARIVPLVMCQTDVKKLIKVATESSVRRNYGSDAAKTCRLTKKKSTHLKT